MALSIREGLFFEPLEFSVGPALADADAAARLMAWYRESGRTTSLHGAFIDVNPAAGDPDFRALSRRRCHESCRIAQALGAKQVVFHASAHPFLRGAYLDSWAGQCAEFYTALSETYGLGLRIENSQDIDCTPLQLLMKHVQGGDVGVCLDIGHANYSSEPMEKWFGELGEHIRYLHLSDNMGRFDDHLPLGAGSVDWAAVHALWTQLNRDMPATLEVGGVEGAEASLAFLRGSGWFGAAFPGGA